MLVFSFCLGSEQEGLKSPIRTTFILSSSLHIKVSTQPSNMSADVITVRVVEIGY